MFVSAKRHPKGALQGKGGQFAPTEHPQQINGGTSLSLTSSQLPDWGHLLAQARQTYEQEKAKGYYAGSSECPNEELFEEILETPTQMMYGSYRPPPSNWTVDELFDRHLPHCLSETMGIAEAKGQDLGSFIEDVSSKATELYAQRGAQNTDVDSIIEAGEELYNMYPDDDISDEATLELARQLAASFLCVMQTSDIIS